MGGNPFKESRSVGGNAAAFGVALEQVLGLVNDSGQAPEWPAPIGVADFVEWRTVVSPGGSESRRLYIQSADGWWFMTNISGLYWQLSTRVNPAAAEKREPLYDWHEAPKIKLNWSPGILPQGLSVTPGDSEEPLGEIVQDWGSAGDDGSGFDALVHDDTQSQGSPLLLVGLAALAYYLLTQGG